MGVPLATVTHDENEGNHPTLYEADLTERVREQLLGLVTRIENMQALLALTHLARPFVPGHGARDIVGGLLAFSLYYYYTVLV